MILEVAPFAKPRMTQRDRWAKRQIVKDYFAFRDTVKQLIQYSFNELLAVKGLGRKCVHEIQGVIEELGLGLAFKEAS